MQSAIRPEKFRIRNNGFTLVELAIGLVVIGLIVGGVLGATQVMQNARINNAVNGLQSIQANVQTYNQNYNALPGDDATATSRFGNSVSHNGDGLGFIGVSPVAETYNTKAAVNSNGGVPESRLVWSHLRAAGLVKGSGDQDTQPANPFNGIYGIQNGAFANGFADGTAVVCMNAVPGTAAQAIDTRLDDGEPESGNVRAGTGKTDGDLATVYTQGSAYVLCTPL